MIWVLDASVAVRWFLKNESHPNADAVLQRLIDCPEFFAVPELFCFEVYAVLCRLHPSGQRNPCGNRGQANHKGCPYVREQRSAPKQQRDELF